MPGPTTYCDVTFVTRSASPTLNVTIPRGSRVVPYPADGTNFVQLATATQRGTCIVETDAFVGLPVAAALMGKGGEFFCIAAVNGNAGDTLYAAANGQVSNVQATGAPIIGIAREVYVAGGLVTITLQGIL